MLNSGLRIIFFDMIDATASLWVSVVVMVVVFLISFVFCFWLPKVHHEMTHQNKNWKPKIKDQFITILHQTQ